jgi:hypothetical protein
MEVGEEEESCLISFTSSPFKPEITFNQFHPAKSLYLFLQDEIKN